MTITLEEKEIKEIVQKYLGDRYTIDSINIINGRLKNRDRLEVTARLAEDECTLPTTDVVEEVASPSIEEQPIFGKRIERTTDG